MIAEHEQVVLTRNIPEHELVSGDVGTVVAVHQEGRGYTVEFMALNGETLAIVTVPAVDIRAARQREIPHVRAAE